MVLYCPTCQNSSLINTRQVKTCVKDCLQKLCVQGSFKLIPALYFWVCKSYTLLLMAEEPDRHRAQQHIETIWIYTVVMDHQY